MIIINDYLCKFVFYVYIFVNFFFTKWLFKIKYKIFKVYIAYTINFINFYFVLQLCEVTYY